MNRSPVHPFAPLAALLALQIFVGNVISAEPARPHIILVMADDQGWGETGYRNHPVLKTPNLDAMAGNGIRFERFYAAAPVCSPTRASVLTGRSNNRTGVETHGFALRRQEKTLAQALQGIGYRTGHFGKWHLNGMRGPGVPVLASDSHRPDVFGFDHWLSVTNFFDRDPLLSRMGTIEGFRGDSSEIVIEEALKFITAQAAATPTLSVVWFGTPHSPFVASREDRDSFADLDEASQHHYGELVALDRSIGTLRRRLRELRIADNTLVWYCSDNGGLPRINPGTVSHLRGFKGTLYEGGLRVPGIIEWPAEIVAPRVTDFPACVMDIFPTIAAVVGLNPTSWVQPQDGINIRPLFSAEMLRREKPIPFNYQGETAIIDNQYKLIQVGRGKKEQSFELYDLEADPSEERNLVTEQPAVSERLQLVMTAWQQELAASISGADYPEGKVRADEPKSRDWSALDVYQPYFEQWRNRPEYKQTLKNK